MLVRDIMTASVVTVGVNDKMTIASDVMQLGRIRHTPVVDDDGSLAGILSQRDLFHNGLLKALGYGARAASKAREMIPVKEAMVSEVITTTPTTPIEDAARLMVEKKIGCLPVLEGDRLVGILTESDLVALVARTSGPR